MLIAQSGTPYSVFCGRGFVPVRNAAGAIVGNSGCDYNADGTNLDRPNVPVLRRLASGGSNDDFLNGIFTAADFPAPGLGQNGTLGRNTFRGPALLQRGPRAGQGVPHAVRGGSGADLQLRLESFNAFDTLNLFNPVNNLADPLFGKSTSALSGRILQFSARFSVLGGPCQAAPEGRLLRQRPTIDVSDATRPGSHPRLRVRSPYDCAVARCARTTSPARWPCWKPGWPPTRRISRRSTCSVSRSRARAGSTRRTGASARPWPRSPGFLPAAKNLAINEFTEGGSRRRRRASSRC